MNKKVFWLSLFLVSIFVVVGCAPSKVAVGYSADMVSRMGQIKIKGKVYVGRDRWRMDIFDPTGKKMITITRADKGVSYVLMPEDKTYMESPMRGAEGQMMMDLSKKLPGEIERKKLGKEKVSGILCDKYKIVSEIPTPMGKTEAITAYIWISMDGIPVKSQIADGSASSTLTNIKRGAQPASLFEIPAGYKKWEMPSF